MNGGDNARVEIVSRVQIRNCKANVTSVNSIFVVAN
jgi:hypothetical protein